MRESAFEVESTPAKINVLRFNYFSTKGNAAEMVSRKLETKIRDALLTSSRTQNTSSPSLFAHDSSGLSNLQRPRM